MKSYYAGLDRGEDQLIDRIEQALIRDAEREASPIPFKPMQGSKPPRFTRHKQVASTCLALAATIMVLLGFRQYPAISLSLQEINIPTTARIRGDANAEKEFKVVSQTLKKRVMDDLRHRYRLSGFALLLQGQPQLHMHVSFEETRTGNMNVSVRFLDENKVGKALVLEHEWGSLDMFRAALDSFSREIVDRLKSHRR